MKYGCSLIVRGEDATPDTFLAMAERAEALEMDSLWLSAHVILPPQEKSGYILIPRRMHPPHWRECYWEPFTVLSFLAAHTRAHHAGHECRRASDAQPLRSREAGRGGGSALQRPVHLRDRRRLVRGGVRGARTELQEPGGAHRRRARADEEALGARPRHVQGPVLLVRGRRVRAQAGAAPASSHLGRRCKPACMSPRGAVRRSVPSDADAAREGRRDAQGARCPVREIRPRSGFGQALRQAPAGLPGRTGGVPRPRARRSRSRTASSVTSRSGPSTSRSTSFRRSGTSRSTRWSASPRRYGRGSIDRSVGQSLGPVGLGRSVGLGQVSVSRGRSVSRSVGRSVARSGQSVGQSVTFGTCRVERQSRNCLRTAGTPFTSGARIRVDGGQRPTPLASVARGRSPWRTAVSVNRGTVRC